MLHKEVSTYFANNMGATCSFSIFVLYYIS